MKISSNVGGTLFIRKPILTTRESRSLVIDQQRK
jgi:hypothetical protein